MRKMNLSNLIDLFEDDELICDEQLLIRISNLEGERQVKIYVMNKDKSSLITRVKVYSSKESEEDRWIKYGQWVGDFKSEVVKRMEEKAKRIASMYMALGAAEKKEEEERAIEINIILGEYKWQ